MKITHIHRKKLEFYLKQFYKHMPDEKFTIFHFVKHFKERHRNNKQTYMGVAGEAGSGKSLFAIMTQILYGRPLDLKKNIVYIPKATEISDKLSSLNFSTLLVDEAARSMRSVSWQSKDQQKVTMLAQTDRFRRNWILLNIPNFQEFTKSLRTGSIMFRAIVLYRTGTHARVVVQRKSRNWRSSDPWGDDEADKSFERRRKKKNINNAVLLDIERSLPSYVMDFAIPNLELILPEVTDEYERLKEDSRKKMNEEDDAPTKKDSKYKNDYEQLMAKVTKMLKYNTLHLGQVKITNKEICEHLGISNSSFNKYLTKEIIDDNSKKKSVIERFTSDTESIDKGLKEGMKELRDR